MLYHSNALLSESNDGCIFPFQICTYFINTLILLIVPVVIIYKNIQEKGEAKEDVNKKLGSVSATVLAKIHDVLKAMIADIKNQQRDIENYEKQVDFSDAAYSREETPSILT